MIVRNAVRMKIVVLLILCAVLHAGATVAVKVFSFEEGLAESNLTKPRIYIQNVGTEAISNFSYRYYFTTEGNEVPIIEDYWTPNESVTLVSLGNNNYYVNYSLAVTLNPGQMSPENSGCVVGIHYNSWRPWDKTNDCSNTRTTTFVENPRIEVYNSSGTRVYGDILSCSFGGDGDTLPPQEMALNSFALFSIASTKVQANTIFTGGGALGSNGDVEIGAGGQVTGNVVAGQNAILRANAVVNGDVFAKNTITTFNGAFVNGMCHENAQIAELTIPQKTVANGTVDKTIASNTTITLDPGNYKNCTVQTNATLILQPGLYTFYNLNVQKKGKIQINAASNQLVQVDIATDLEFYDSCEVKFQTHGYSPAVRFYTNDANTIRIGYGAKVTGILSAPLASLTMYAGSRCDGAIYAKQITVEHGASMASEDVNIDSDTDGDGVPNGVEILSGTDPAQRTSFKLIAIPHPGVIDNTVASTITYDLARFSPEYATNGTATLALPARALKNGVSNVLMKVSNKAVDFDGGIVTGSQLPSTSNYATRFFSFKSGIFMPSAQITLTVPIVANDIGVTNYSYDYYNDATNSWVTGNAPEIIEVEGVPSFRLTMTAPKILVVHEKITSDVAYLDGGTILTSSKEMSDVVVDFQITGVASDAIASYQIHYDDYSTTPASPKEFQGSFSRTEIDGVSSLQCDFSEGAISSTGTIVIKRVVITSSENITYDYSNTEYTVLPGQRVTLKADAKPVCYATSSGRDPVAVLYDNNYVLESFDLDGEGRIKKSPAGTGFVYDYFIRDNLGSTRMVVNDNGDVREASLYMGYGKIVPLYSQNGYSKVRDKFTGKEFDTESGLGLFYFGARYYDPDLGVWTSPDPMDQYWDAYSYCGADPVNYIDVAGEKGTPVHIVKAILAKLGVKETPELVGKLSKVSIRNSKLAGKQHKSGVWFTELGFPDFEEYCRTHNVVGYQKVYVSGLEYNHTTDFDKANEALRLTRTPKNFTWHHNEKGYMELVPTEIHEAVGHTGAVSLFSKLGIKAGFTFSTVLTSLILGEDSENDQSLSLLFDLINPFQLLDLSSALNDAAISTIGIDDDYMFARDNEMHIQPPSDETITISNSGSTGHGSTPTPPPPSTPNGKVSIGPGATGGY